MIPTVQVLGVPLARLSVPEAVARGLEGGLVLAPSGPGLCDLARDPEYRAALLGSELNLTDSGLVILMWSLRGRRHLPRTSGLGYLAELLRRPELEAAGATFWVMPSRESMRRNLDWLSTQGLEVTEEDCYIAPFYPRRGSIEDRVLLDLIQERRPHHVFICIGSGAQEKLGLYLRKDLPYVPGIHCIGAAIGFLSGDQVTIPLWADRLLLGWLVRCISDPRRFVPRYLRAVKLVYLLLRYDQHAPPIAPSI